jgi:hypothetical protein
MSQHDHQSRPQPAYRELDAFDLGWGSDVSGHPNDEQVSQALIEYDLRRHP